MKLPAHRAWLAGHLPVNFSPEKPVELIRPNLLTSPPLLKPIWVKKCCISPVFVLMIHWLWLKKGFHIIKKKEVKNG